MPRLFVAAGIFHPEPGGPATYLSEILPGLQACGWNVRVLTYGDSSEDEYPYPVTRIPRQFFPLRRFKYALAARRELAQADLVYAHTIDLPLSGGGVPRLIKIVGDQAWERCIRRGWIPPDTDIDTFQTQPYGVLAEWQKASRTRQVKAMAGVIVPSQYLKRMVAGWGVPEDRIYVIYNALPSVDDLSIRAQHAAPLQSVARQKMGWPDVPTILTAARLTPWKGIDHLITALKSVPEIRLVVAGEGEDLLRLKALAEPLEERVVFTGRLSREVLYTAMQAADYFVLYSGYEGLPHTLLESLRVGTPIIASDKGGNAEVVQHGGNGFVVPYVNRDALIDTLRHAFQPGVREKLAANTRLGMERFTFDYMVKETDRVLRLFLR